MKRQEKEEFEPVIAKGKRKEFFKDKVIEFTEDLFYTISERWKEVLVGFAGVILAVGLILGVFEYRKNKIKNEFLTFESAYQLIVSYDMTKDSKFIDEAVAKLYQVQSNPKYISKVFLAWALSKQEKYNEASEILNQIIYDDKLVLGLRKLATVLKINILAGKDCEEIIKTWKFMKDKEKNLSPEEIDKAFSVIPIPIRTYFEIIRCSDKNPEVLQDLLYEIDFMYMIERLVSQDRANMFVVLKNYAYQRLRGLPTGLPTTEFPIQQPEKLEKQ